MLITYQCPACQAENKVLMLQPVKWSNCLRCGEHVVISFMTEEQFLRRRLRGRKDNETLD